MPGCLICLADAADAQCWVPHLKIKQYHFEAAAQFRKSMDDSENARYGLELARLAQASQWARRGIESKHTEVARLVIQDIQVSTIKRLLLSSLVFETYYPISSLDPLRLHRRTVGQCSTR
jgi:BRO1-like domain